MDFCKVSLIFFAVVAAAFAMPAADGPEATFDREGRQFGLSSANAQAAASSGGIGYPGSYGYPGFGSSPSFSNAQAQASANSFGRQGRQFGFDLSSANAQASASSGNFGGGYPGYFGGYPGFGGGSSFANAQASANSFGR